VTVIQLSWDNQEDASKDTRWWKLSEEVSKEIVRRRFEGSASLPFFLPLSTVKTPLVRHHAFFFAGKQQEHHRMLLFQKSGQEAQLTPLGQ
jgi:hypothetical protein